MAKKLILMSSTLLLMVAVVFAAGIVERQEATVVEGLQELQRDYARSPMAACSMQKHSDVPSSYWSEYETGIRTVTYFDPIVECAALAYPFGITSFSFVLYDPGGYTWPAQVDVVVFDMADPTDACVGPGQELCRYSVTATEAIFGYPNVGTVIFPEPCCVDGPFFIGLEYTAGTATTTPSVLFDDRVPVFCDNYQMYSDGLWYEWFDFWADPVSGYPIFYVDGETEHGDCLPGWQVGDGHKMHYPQLPDEAGWDVNATYPAVLADDWECSETGWVKDFHFWGSWLDGVTGDIESFNIEIWSDIPAGESPTGYSMPGEMLWAQVIHDYLPIQIDPATYEGWYDPETGIVLQDNHIQYFQYNVYLDEPDWFWQDAGTIYWLKISANVVDPIGTHWGWKSSLDHWNDDAVWGEIGAMCTAPDNGTGTIDYPADCPFTAPDDNMEIIDGLPPGTTIEIDPTLMAIVGQSEVPGGQLGGTVATFDATLQLSMTGTGMLDGFSRNISMPVSLEVHTAPRNPGDPVQEFPTELWFMTGSVVGDPDFDMLEITAGTGVGLPSPGSTTITDLGDGTFNVDSFFDITYRIDFTGAPGGVLDGMSGSTQGTVRMEQGGMTWNELYEPATVLPPITNTFWGQWGPMGEFLDGGGSDFFGTGWYFYPLEDWWNIWFYDHPYDPARYKEIHIEFDANPIDDGMPAFIELAVNWSTAAWSIDQLPGDSAPPLPGADELLYIGRTTLLVAEFFQGHYVFDYVIPEYNPEWVSIDVRGFNFEIYNGEITHQCLAQGHSGVSMDLSFVITGGPPENTPPIGMCTDVTVDADINCQAMASIDNGSYDPDGDPITITQIPPGPYPLGGTQVMLIVADDSGAADTCYANVTVVDNTYPQVTCPNDTSINIVPPATGINVTYTALATDNCPGVTVTYNPQSGALFPIGVTPVEVIATDASGNADTCHFSVTVTASCCGLYTGGYTGNANCGTDGKITLSDITKLIDRVYISKLPLCCEENGNTNGSLDGKITLSDITRLIDKVYISKLPTAPCP